MRTTVNINDSLLVEAKERANREGRSLGDVINDALREDSARRKAMPAPAQRKPLTTFGGDGVRPGVNLDHMSELLDIMDGIL